MSKVKKMQSSLSYGLPKEWLLQGTLLHAGYIIMFTSGKADIVVNHQLCQIEGKMIKVLFPGDFISVRSVSPDMGCSVLAYTSEMLREAALRMEISVYEILREMGYTNSPFATSLVQHYFHILELYDAHPDVYNFDRQVVLMLQSYFLGFHEYIGRGMALGNVKNRGYIARTNKTFNQFMHILSKQYYTHSEVAFYAERLSITPKHLNHIVKQSTGRSAKQIIHNYIITRIKADLLHSHSTIKELAYKYHFSSPSHFCQFFKKYMEVSPQRYRENGTVVE